MFELWQRLMHRFTLQEQADEKFEVLPVDYHSGLR